MNNWYKSKMEFHFKEWEIAQETSKEKAASHHMNEYLNYKTLHDTHGERYGIKHILKGTTN